MTRSSTWWRILALSTIVLCIVFAVRAGGQDKKPASTLATVDFQKIVSESKARKDISDQLQAMRARFDKQLQRRDQMPFLTEAEQKELDEIDKKDVAARSEAEKKRWDELVKKATDLSNEIQALRQKPEKDLTAEDKKKISDAEQTFVKAQQQYAALRDQLTNELQQFEKTNSEKLMKEIRAAVTKVAEPKGITMVFNNEVVLYAGVDLTEPVLAELNKKK